MERKKDAIKECLSAGLSRTKTAFVLGISRDVVDEYLAELHIPEHMDRMIRRGLKITQISGSLGVSKAMVYQFARTRGLKVGKKVL